MRNTLAAGISVVVVFAGGTAVGLERAAPAQANQFYEGQVCKLNAQWEAIYNAAGFTCQKLSNPPFAVLVKKIGG